MRRVMATLLLAAAVPAQADMAAPERQKLHAYLSGSDYIDALAKIGIYWDRSVLGRHTDCQSRYEVAPMAFGVLDPVQFDPESSQPRQGIWRQRFGLTRCGEQAIYNVLAIVRDGKLQLQPQVPGDSRVAPVLLSQLLREGVAAVRRSWRRAWGPVRAPPWPTPELPWHRRTVFLPARGRRTCGRSTGPSSAATAGSR